MATAAQIEANRRNAKKSTGPRTQEGKDRVRHNALKHGRSAALLLPVLPHEDARQARRRIEQYLLDWQPSTEAERDLVCQAARLSLVIERAERMETAHMTARVQTAAQDQIQAIHPQRMAEVQELGRRLLYIAAAEEIKILYKPLWKDDARLLVARLEATVAGTRWLLARWAEFRQLLARKTRWEIPVLLRFVRLQGKDPVELTFDTELNAIFVAWDVLVPGSAKQFWEKYRDVPTQAQTAWLGGLKWREISPRPASHPEAWKVLSTIVDQQTKRLERLLERNLDMESEECTGWPDRAALDMSPEFERHRRHLSAKTRELHRTRELLCKMRQAGGGKGKAEEPMADGECHIAEDTGQMIEDQCQLADGTAEMAAGEGQPAHEDNQAVGRGLQEMDGVGDSHCSTATHQKVSGKADLEKKQAIVKQELPTTQADPPAAKQTHLSGRCSDSNAGQAGSNPQGHATASPTRSISWVPVCAPGPDSELNPDPGDRNTRPADP